MRTITLLTLLIILALTATAQNNLYLQDSLEVQLDITGGFTLEAQGNNPTVQDVTTQLLLYPQKDFRQNIVSLDTSGTSQDTKILFRWDDQQLGTKKFGYSARIKTKDQRLKVKSKMPFPLPAESIQGLEQYLQPTETIDSTDPTVVAKATELVEGEDDMYKAVFKLANWVDENVKYDLTTLTAETSQKASWVLENKEGVCDEMTSLFVAMARAVGIPARFVSGVSYTTSDLFDAPWQPHGWAEVYFPDIGWVSFDIAFGEYGYVDVTHIKLRDGFDPQEPATKYEWLAHDVNLDAQPLKVSASIIKKGNHLPDDIELEQEILATETGFGSYNLVKGIVKNNADYYASSTLQLSIPPELDIIGKNKRTILLLPKETRETFWIIRVPATLDKNYLYTFPTNIYTEKNVSVQDLFVVQNGNQFYSQQDIQQLVVKDEEKSYSRKIAFDCDYPHELKWGQSADVVCRIKNTGNANLRGVNFCLEGVCDVINLAINQEWSASVKITGNLVGWQKAVVSAENELVEKRSVLEYVVRDDPALALNLSASELLTLDNPIALTIVLQKTSFTEPQDLIIIAEGLGTEQKIEVEKMTGLQTFQLDFDGRRIGKNNEFKIAVLWKDKEGKLFSEKQILLIPGTASGLAGKMKLWFNSFLGLFW